MTSTQRTVVALTCAAICFLLTLAALEAGLRVVGRPAWDPPVRAGWKYARNSEAHALGFRGQPIEYDGSNIVVVLLGDSFVESVASPVSRMPEQLLQQRLRAIDSRHKVFTLGTGGYGTDQQLFALEEYFQRHRADWIILWQTLSNDVWNNMFPTHWPKDGMLKPTFWIEQGELRGPNYRMGEIVQPAARTKLGVFFNRWRDPRRGLDQAWERRLPPAYAPLSAHHGPVKTEWDPAGIHAGVNPLLRDENLGTEKSHMAIWLTPRSPRMQYGIDLTRRLYAQIAGLCRTNGARFAIFSPETPDQRQADSSDVVVQKVGEKFFKSSRSQFRENRSALNRGFEVFVIPVLAADWRLSESDGHFNDRTNDQLMAALAEQMCGQRSAEPRVTSMGPRN